MRWQGTKFALFAVAALLLAVPSVATAQSDPAETVTTLLWRNQAQQPIGDTTFFVSVANGDTEDERVPPLCASGTADAACPADTIVKVKMDGGPEVIRPLRKPDPDDPQASITNDFVLPLGQSPHYFISKYAGSETFDDSTDEFGIAIPSLTASPEPSRQGELVTFTFHLEIWPASPNKPEGAVQFTDNDNHASGPNHPQLDGNRNALWTLGQRAGRWATTAVYTGDDFYSSVSLTREHNVDGPPGVSTPPTRPTSTRVPVSQPRARSATTAALAPINPSTTSLNRDSTTTQATFGAFPTTPRAGSQVAAGEEQDDGPPVAVVVTTLGALGVLGGIAAFRRYRRSGIDWF